MSDPGMTVDLNADLGEGFPWDAPLLERITSASVSCGSHAGDPDSIRATLARAHDLGVVVGAHPGFPDRPNFGRREQAITAEDARALILEQTTALGVIAGPIEARVRFLKPHGALYNQAQRDDEIAAGVVAAAAALGLPILGQPGSVVERLARQEGVRFITEGFADRRTLPNGRLVPRSAPGAFLTEPAEIADQVRLLVSQGVRTICLHGDDPRSVVLADLVREVLAASGVLVRPFL